MKHNIAVNYIIYFIIIFFNTFNYVYFQFNLIFLKGANLMSFENAITEYRELNEITIEDLPEEFKDIAETIGMEALIDLLKLRGGESVYFCKIETVGRNARNRRIHEEFNGTNYRQLAKKYKLTVSMIRQILKN